MRHKISGRKLNRTTSHRNAMLANMAVSLVMHEQIKTTLPKAKELRPYVEKLLTIAKSSDVMSSTRRILSKIKNKDAATKLVSVLAKRYHARLGGYTRIVKSGFRYGDVADMAYIEFVEKDVLAKGSVLGAKTLHNPQLSSKQS